MGLSWREKYSKLRRPLFTLSYPLHAPFLAVLLHTLLHFLPEHNMALSASATAGLKDMPEEILVRIATHLELSDVCRLRATCRTLVGRSAALAGACKYVCLELKRSYDDATLAPPAVLAWAVCGLPSQRLCKGAFLAGVAVMVVKQDNGDFRAWRVDLSRETRMPHRHQSMVGERSSGGKETVLGTALSEPKRDRRAK